MQALIGIAVTGTMAAVFASMMSQMNSQYNMLARKLESADLKTAVMTALNQGEVCNWQLAGKNLTGLVGTLGVSGLSIPTLYSGTTATSQPLAQVGELLPGSTSNLRVSRIEFKNISAFSGPTSYQGQLEIDFEQGKNHAPMRPIQIGLRVETNPGLVVTSCLLANQNITSGPNLGSATSSGAPGNLKLGNCDEVPVPRMSGLYQPPNPSKANFQAAKDQLCDLINFPVPDSGQVSFKNNPCYVLDLKLITLATGSNLVAASQLMKNYGLAQNCPLTLNQTAPSGPVTYNSSMLAGLSSADQCKQIPSYPQGSSVTTMDQTFAAAVTSKGEGRLCIGGNWLTYDPHP